MTEFNIFAVVVTSEGSVGKRKLKAFTPYFLCDGWHFEGSKIIRSKKKCYTNLPTMNICNRKTDNLCLSRLLLEKMDLVKAH